MIGAPQVRLARATTIALGVSVLCAAAAAWGQTPGATGPNRLVGRAVSVESGDTLTVLDPDGAPHRVRLAGIEAPVWGRPGAHRSKDSLSSLALDQPVRVEWFVRDARQRMLGRLWVASPDAPCRGKPDCPMTLDAGLAQLTRGRARWSAAHDGERSDEIRGQYEFAEREARAKKAGIWRDPGQPGAGFGKTGVP